MSETINKSLCIPSGLSRRTQLGAGDLDCVQFRNNECFKWWE